MPNSLRIMRQGEDYIDAEAARRAFVPTCAFCSTPMKGKRCQNCGAPLPEDVPPEKKLVTLLEGLGLPVKVAGKVKR